MPTPLPIVLMPGWVSVTLATSINELAPQDPTKVKNGYVSAVDTSGTSQVSVDQFILFKSNEKEQLTVILDGQKFYFIKESDIIYVENPVIPV